MKTKPVRSINIKVMGQPLEYEELQFLETNYPFIYQDLAYRDANENFEEGFVMVYDSGYAEVINIFSLNSFKEKGKAFDREVFKETILDLGCQLIFREVEKGRVYKVRCDAPVLMSEEDWICVTESLKRVVGREDLLQLPIECKHR